MELLLLLSVLPPLLLSVHGGNWLSVEGSCFEAIYQFGDSLADTGNAVRIVSRSECGLPPYGQTFFDHPTGRCSDGLLMIDFFGNIFILLSVYFDFMTCVILGEAMSLNDIK